jgi:hypothetical protein
MRATSTSWRPSEMPPRDCDSASSMSLSGWELPSGRALGGWIEGWAVARGPRVGVDYAGEAAAWPLRFAIRGNPHVSRPRLGAATAGGAGDQG